MGETGGRRLRAPIGEGEGVQTSWNGVPSLAAGQPVYSVEGKRVGTVAAVGLGGDGVPIGMMVASKFFFKERRLFMPSTWIAAADEHGVRLALPARVVRRELALKTI
jgi:hypothetical protein